MSKMQEEHLQYWRELAAGLKQGTPVLKVLKAAEAKVADAQFRRAAKAVIDAINEGSTLSEAMAEHGSVFSRHVCALVRAGEAGGVLDVICERIAQAHENLTLGPDATGPEGEHARYWRTFGLLLSSGVPILDALDLAADVVISTELSNASRAVREAIREGGDMCSAMRRFPEVFPEPICAAVEAAEGEGELDRQASRIADALDADDLSGLAPSRSEMLARLQTLDQASPAVRFVYELLCEAVRRGASDIHLDPSADGRGHVRLRVDGVLHEVERPEKGLFAKAIRRIKIMSALDIAERRLPQDGRIATKINDKSVDFRVSLVPVHFGERVVLRILRQDAVILGLEDTGLSGDDLAAVRRLSHLPSGIIICNGPVGSGKTTLLYSMLQEVDRQKCCVMTIEDPVEYSFEGMGQIQTDAQRGLTYARALRHILRQDPDVIMVGEIRDLPTMEACVQCALTGHLVLTTLHTNSGPDAIKRILDVGMTPFLLNASLAGVISQRLVRVLCDECKKQADPPLHSVPPEGVEFIRAAGKKAFYAPVGCKACGGGYRGRTAIHEILVMDESIRQAVADGADMAALREAAGQAGTKTMLISGLEKAARGITSVEEVIRVVPHGMNF